jgi:N-hydroxyarylamine O-acetyltransferase
MTLATTPDIAAYFQRIGYTGPVHADQEVLAAIVLRHVQSIPFENLDAFLGRGVALDFRHVEDKLVRAKRGGWCFEQNLLLGNVLRALGFEVIDLAARVVWGREATVTAARTHRLLSVRTGGKSYLVDVGFGGPTPTGVLDLASELEQATPHEPFRIRSLGAERLLEIFAADVWLPLYRFTFEAQQHIDYEAANFQLAHDPTSHFVQGLRVSRVEAQGRYTLRDHELAYHDLRNGTTHRKLSDVTALRQVLHDTFGIDTSGLPELDARLQRMNFK